MPSFELQSFSLDDLTVCADRIRGVAGEVDSAEQAAGAIVEYLHGSLRQADGTPATALVRLYKTLPYERLEPELQAFASGALGSTPAPATRCLTLLGTAGELPDWNDRRRSAGHRTIPLASPEMVARLPMVARLIEQLGLDAALVVDPPAERLVDLAQRAYDVFHVARAEGSPYLPAQDFVAEHGIRSAVGFGGMLFAGDFYAVLLFSKVSVSERVARNLRILSLAVRVALQPFGHDRVFAR
ncbi:MAG: hypothetical protein ACR2MU_05370 [Gaiellaceae bacterium]